MYRASCATIKDLDCSTEAVTLGLLITKLQTRSQFAEKMSEKKLLTTKQRMYKRWSNSCSQMVTVSLQELSLHRKEISGHETHSVLINCS
jgi:hypothetical protein